MALFRVTVAFELEKASSETAGPELQRLKEAARSVGFVIPTARVEPSPPQPPTPSTGTPYESRDP